MNAAYQKNPQEKWPPPPPPRTKPLADLQAEQAKFMDAQKAADAEKKNLADQLSKAQQDKTAEVDKVKKEVEVLQKDIASSKVLVKDLAGEKEKLLGRPMPWTTARSAASISAPAPSGSTWARPTACGRKSRSPCIGPGCRPTKKAARPASKSRTSSATTWPKRASWKTA